MPQTSAQAVESDPSTTTRAALRASATLVGTRLGLQDVNRTGAVAHSPLTFAENGGWIVLFRVGALVTIGLDPSRQRSWRTRIGPLTEEPATDPAVEEVDVRIDPHAAEGVTAKGELTLRRDQVRAARTGPRAQPQARADLESRRDLPRAAQQSPGATRRVVHRPPHHGGDPPLPLHDLLAARQIDPFRSQRARGCRSKWNVSLGSRARSGAPKDGCDARRRRCPPRRGSARGGSDRRSTRCRWWQSCGHRTPGGAPVERVALHR